VLRNFTKAEARKVIRNIVEALSDSPIGTQRQQRDCSESEPVYE